MKKLKLIALFAAAIVGLGVYQFLQEMKKPQEVPRTTVVVAATFIPENTQITAEMVTTKAIANESLLENHMQELSSVVGMVMSSDVYPGEQILRDRLIQIGETDSDPNTLAFAVEPGMRAMTIFVNVDTGLVNFLKPGNRVDIVANYAIESTRAVLNSEEGELEWIQLPMAQMLEQNLKILAVGATMNKAGTEEYTSVTLQVTPQEALEISAVPSWGGSLRLLLRSPLDDEIVELELLDPAAVYSKGAED